MVTLLSTAFQSENTTLEELFDCLITLYKFEPDLLIEKAAAEERLLSIIDKRGCVFPMVIWPEFRMGQYRVNDHPYHASQFIILITIRKQFKVKITSW